jgi:hypothetical protein
MAIFMAIFAAFVRQGGAEEDDLTTGNAGQVTVARKSSARARLAETRDGDPVDFGCRCPWARIYVIARWHLLIELTPIPA